MSLRGLTVLALTAEGRAALEDLAGRWGCSLRAAVEHATAFALAEGASGPEFPAVVPAEHAWARARRLGACRVAWTTRAGLPAVLSAARKAGVPGWVALLLEGREAAVLFGAAAGREDEVGLALVQAGALGVERLTERLAGVLERIAEGGPGRVVRWSHGWSVAREKSWEAARRREDDE